MATTRGKGTAAKRGSAKTDAVAEQAGAARTRAPGDDIGGVAEPAAAAPAPPAAKKRGGSTRETYVETAARRKKEKEVDKLQADLRAFAQGRPGGWSHDDWLAFLADLGERGHDVSDPDGIGARLERERLRVMLGAVQGLGPKRVEALVDRFDTLWSMRRASTDEVAAVAGMTRPVAERLVEELRAA